MVCFVILHYMVVEETLSCVENIKTLKGQYKIVIVDNGSPNNSGVVLQEKYAADPDIAVLLNSENSGFAKGNNAGCRFAKKLYGPDFYIVMNNDVEIRQTDFVDRIYKIWNQDNFDVLSPDIYSTTGKVHQSPKSLENMTLKKAKKLQEEYKKKLNSKFVVPLRCYLKQVRFLKLFYNRAKSHSLNIDYKKKYYDVPLHGACLIFSRNFVESRKEVFFNGTFFYFESEILDYECQLSGWKEVYDPSIQVLHHQNVSTNIAYANALKKVRFMNEQNYKSITAFLECFGKK